MMIMVTYVTMIWLRDGMVKCGDSSSNGVGDGDSCRE